MRDRHYRRRRKARRKLRQLSQAYSIRRITVAALSVLMPKLEIEMKRYGASA